MNNLQHIYSKKLPSGAILAVAEIPISTAPNPESSTRQKRERSAWHALARELLSNPAAQFSYNNVGAPQIEGSPLYIGVSHSATLVAVIISSERTSIDIESQNRNFAAVASRYISNEERKLSPDPESPIFQSQIWSIKEVAYKYAGIKELNLLTDISVLELTENSFKARIRDHHFSGTLTTISDHTLAYVG